MRVPPRASLAVALVFLGVYAALLFVRLGNYALWDDEANTALFAQSVWRTGDTLATIGDNVVAYGGGYELDGLVNRRLSPLQYYVAAPFVGQIGGTWGARLPFALAGLVLGVLVQVWLWSTRAPLSRWILVDLGFIGNVSLLLYCRQSRYYALVLLFASIVAYLYARFDGSRANLLLLSLSAVALFASNYLSYAALAVAIGVDYLLFGTRRRALTLSELATFGAIQALFCLPMAWMWNPMGKTLKSYVPQQSWWIEKLELWWWNVRDLDACEFGSVAILCLAPVLYFLRGRTDDALVRLPLGILVIAGAVSLFSPQTVSWNERSEIRYMVVVIPACILLSARVVETLRFPREGWRYAFAVILFATNTAQVARASLLGSVHPAEWRSTLRAYVRELRDPPPSPQRAAADWLGAHAAPGETVLVLPDYENYPLMFHRPELIYVWQFPLRARAEFPGLADHHFRWLEPPIWVVVFESKVEVLPALFRGLANVGATYERAHAITDVNGRHRNRPELDQRSFEPKPVKDVETDGIYFFRRTHPNSWPSGSPSPP